MLIIVVVYILSYLFFLILISLVIIFFFFFFYIYLLLYLSISIGSEYFYKTLSEASQYAYETLQCDALVNCSGIGSAALCDDEAVVAGRGGIAVFESKHVLLRMTKEKYSKMRKGEIMLEVVVVVVVVVIFVQRVMTPM
jgi:hypothetical protein